MRRPRWQPAKSTKFKKGAPRVKSVTKAKKLTSLGDQLPGHSDKYTLALNHLIHQVGNLDIQPRKTNVWVTFKVNSKRHKVPAYVDSGNSFFNCIAKETYERIGFTLSQLESSPTPAIRQAGGGVTLKILGKVPNAKDDGFAFESSKNFFPLKDIFVVEGLHHEFNISYTFM